MHKPFQSVRSKMVLSYLAVVLVIALLFGSILYLFFSHQYSKEIRINNQLSLKSTVNTIESSVIQKVNQVYLSLALGNAASIDLDSLKGNHSKILDIEQSLKNMVQNIPISLKLFMCTIRRTTSSSHPCMGYCSMRHSFECMSIVGLDRCDERNSKKAPYGCKLA